MIYFNTQANAKFNAVGCALESYRMIHRTPWLSPAERVHSSQVPVIAGSDGDLGLHLMRFVMMERVSSREEVLSFLVDLKDALAAFTAGLESYAPVAVQFDDRHPALALDHGLEVTRASLRWARRTIAILRAVPAPVS